MGSKEGGVDLIAVERRRQIEAEGWTPEHDDEHQTFELAQAAGCYLLAAELPAYWCDNVPARWPWHVDWWKPSDDPIRNLVKAGALIAAEIDRLQRERCGMTVVKRADLQAILAELDALRRATGGLPPALVAKALDIAVADETFTDNELHALCAATFEVRS